MSGLSGRCIRFPIQALLVLLVTTGAGGVALGATFDVNMTTDGLDTLPGDGLCQSVGGLCTLRAAIMEANALSGPDIVRLRNQGPYLLSIPGTGDDAAALGDLDITDDLEIRTLVKCHQTPTNSCPKPVIIDGNHLDRVFHVLPGATVKIYGVTIQNGDVVDDGGGIRNEGKLTLGTVVVTGNETLGSGGGIFNAPDALLALLNSTIRDNIAGDAGGGLRNTEGTVTLVRSSASDNTAGGRGGGALFAYDH